MTPQTQSLILGALLALILGIILVGYATPTDRCHIVSEVYREAHNRRPPLRGSSDDGLNLAESFAIGAANTVSNALGVSCYIDGTRA